MDLELFPYHTGPLLKGSHQHHSGLEMTVYKTILKPKAYNYRKLGTDTKSAQQSINLGWRRISVKMDSDFSRCAFLYHISVVSIPEWCRGQEVCVVKANPLLPAHIFRLYLQLVAKCEACTRAPLPSERNQTESTTDISPYNLITHEGSMSFATVGWQCNIQEWDKDKMLLRLFRLNPNYLLFQPPYFAGFNQ